MGRHESLVGHEGWRSGGVEHALERAELLACIHPDVIAVERRVDVVTVLDRQGREVRVASALVVVKRDGTRLGVVVMPGSLLGAAVAWPAVVVGTPVSPAAPRVLVTPPARELDGAFETGEPSRAGGSRTLLRTGTTAIGDAIAMGPAD